MTDCWETGWFQYTGHAEIAELMELFKDFELKSHNTTVISITGDTALASVTGHDEHTPEGANADYAYSSVSAYSVLMSTPSSLLVYRAYVDSRFGQESCSTPEGPGPQQ